MAIGAFDHPLLAGLLGDPEVATWFTVDAELAAMLDFERALARAEAKCGIIPDVAARSILATLDGFVPDVTALSAASARDGLIVPALVRQMRAAVPDPHKQHVHFASTSQDVIDTALVLRLAPCLDIFAVRLGAVCRQVEALVEAAGDRPLIGRTRMQRAVPVRYADRLTNWLIPLQELGADLARVRGASIRLQCGGAAGTLDKLGNDGPAVARALGAELDLPVPEHHWQTNRHGLAGLAHWCAGVTGALGKIGQDIALMTQNELAELQVTSGGGSSAMPHKVNPVAAEVLVALARFTATQSAGMQHVLVHEQERSGAAWTQEWLLLPQVIAATGTALIRARGLLDSVELPTDTPG
ncbi:MAG: 3-carboxy-cis,cis-muconate cycloisomerase [Minwuia sp.]|nr:3-carboxy-cis,cis-muconate cycloisomerase [Minwuia sp.]